MDIALRIDLNIFSCLVLLVLWLSTFQNIGRKNIQQRLYFYLMVMTIGMLCLESASWMLDGLEGFRFYILAYVINIALFALTPVPALLWMMYADYQIFTNSNRLKTCIIIMLFPLAVNTVICIGSPVFQMFFYIDSANLYHRGPWFPLFLAICLLPQFYVLLLIIINRSRLSSQELYSMASFPILPLVGGILQTVFYGVTLTWNCVTLGLLIIYVNIQYSLAHTDYLTGVYNRRQADQYIRKKIRATEQGHGFSGILIDLDDFKIINDRYGHEEGDKCLAMVVQLLRRTLRRDDFLARLGGDEFLVVLDISKREELNRAIARIHDCFKEYNLQSGKGYIIGVSMGADVYDPRKRQNRSSFIKHLDRLMYSDKMGRKDARKNNRPPRIATGVPEYEQ